MEWLEALCFEKNQCPGPVAEKLATAVSNRPNFKSLSFSHCDMTDTAFAILSENLSSSSLKELDISWNKLTGESFAGVQAIL